MDGMITLKDVCKTYCIGGDTVHALDHANMVIREGEFVSIIGPSGSGKSTMMNIIGCLDTADEGTYILDGISIEDYTERELAKIRNHKIGFIFQSFNLLPKLTAEENVELPLIYQKISKSERKRRVKEALEKVELSHRMGHRPTELSSGQQQRVAIARALVTRPSLFLADEPTGNLDSSTGEEIMKLFHELHANGNTIVLITHDNGVTDEDSLEPAENALTELLMERFGQDEDVFSIVDQSEIMEAMSSVTNTMSLMIGGIAAISLLVGGIGIMNIMLVSVTERTREIGIRKAIGAGRGTIMLQFLIEALLVSLMGCLAGIGLSWVILKVAAVVMNNSMSFTMDMKVVWLSVAFSVLIGVLFGLYPANKAASKKPIDALRYSG